MKDILKIIVKYIPTYSNDFLSLAGSPKQFISSRNTENIENNLANALAFLGITLCLIWLLQAPLIEKDEFFARFASALVLLLLNVVLFSAAVRLSWSIVGGKASLKAFIITYAYFTSGLIFIITIFFMISSGITKVLSPDLFEILLTQNPQTILDADLFADTGFVVGFCFLVAGLIIGNIWGLIGWGAFRQLNGLSKKHSLGALFLVSFFSLPVTGLTYFISQLMA